MTPKEFGEWWQTQKNYFIAEHHKKLPDGRTIFTIRNAHKTIKLGDWYGGAKVLAIEAYGKQLENLGEGMTGLLTLSRMPMFVVHQDDPDCVEWQEQKLKQQPETTAPSP
jgi:hypothetical protein